MSMRPHRRKARGGHGGGGRFGRNQTSTTASSSSNSSSSSSSTAAASSSLSMDEQKYNGAENHVISSHGNNGSSSSNLSAPSSSSTTNKHRRRTSQRFVTIDKAKNPRGQLKICVGDKISLVDDTEGYVHFIGPVQTDRRGMVERIGVEIIGAMKKKGTDGTFYNRRYFFPSKHNSAVIVPKTKVLSIIKPINGPRLHIHDKVRVKGRTNGEIKFIGPTLFGPHIWYGVELEKKFGKNNGMVQGVRYFEAQQLRGIFIREEKLIPLDKMGRPKEPQITYPPKSKQEMAVDLFEACAKGDLKTVRAILAIDKTVALNAVDPSTEASALMTACYHGYYLIVQELLNTKVLDVSEQNYHGLNALHFTAQAGFDNIVELLCKYGMDVDMRTEDGITALYIAVEKGHENVVEKLLSKFADVNLSSRDDESPLIQACHRGFHRIVAQLLRAPNIKVNQKRKNDGATALFVACREGSVECVKHLLSNPQIRINESKTNGRSPLFISSFFGHSAIVEALLNHSEKMAARELKHGVIDVDQCDSKGFTPLFVAAQNGHVDIVKLLLEAGADVNQAEQRGHTPLWISGLRGHLDVVRTLLAHPSIDIDYKDLSGVTALWAACQNNNVDVVELLLHPRDIEVKEEPVIDTSGQMNGDMNGHENGSGGPNGVTNSETGPGRVKHKKVVSLTSSDGLFLPMNNFDDISEDKEVDGIDLAEIAKSAVRDSHESRPSIDDSSGGVGARHSQTDRPPIRKHVHKRTNSKLLWKKKGSRQGANPNCAKHDGCTPLWIAASRGNHECMKHLVNYGADLDKSDRTQGATPLFVACQNGKKKAVDLLLSSHANVNKPRNGDGTTPLMMSSHNGHSDIVEVLLRSGADPLRSNSTGLNALGCASMQGHARIVKLCYQHLLRTKTPEEIRKFVNSGDQVNGWTPLHLACMGGHSRVIKYLIEKVKVDIFKKDYENKTGLEHAWQNGHQNIVAWLSALENKYPDV